MQSEELKEKAKQTSQEHFGCDYPNQSEDLKRKQKETNIEKYGCECVVYRMKKLMKRENKQ